MLILSKLFRLDKAYASGVEQIGKGFVGNKEIICLNFRASIGEKKAKIYFEVMGGVENNFYFSGLIIKIN